MAELKIEVVEIDNVIKHPNADRLDICTIKGWECVSGRGQFLVGEKAVYIPIDSILPEELEAKVFGNSKIKLNKHRVRTIRIRGAVSQGLLVPLETLGIKETVKVGSDLTGELGVTKYEPKDVPSGMRTNLKKVTKANPNPHFHKYTDIKNIKNYNELFANSEIVVSEKIHGSSFRASFVKKDKLSLWEKTKKLFGLKVSEYIFAYGSRNVQLHLQGSWKGYYKTNIYAEMVHKYDLEDKLRDGEAIYGECFGSGIQKNYHYGCGQDERKLVVFDVMVNDIWLSFDEMKDFCIARELPSVPELYRGKYDYDKVVAACSGPSILAPEQPIIEGGVIKEIVEKTSYIGRKVLKIINSDYLLQKGNTDFH